ncbi:MAG: AgmX/PglI C-terminal domain-containing protein [Deltaproteobacteria bacterium]|nr:AgmX/PglI C-terminal domain-containing protein [Deltaproteobacteria bacterium]
MFRVALFALTFGCVSHTPTPIAPAAQPAAAPLGGKTYGGQPYGGQRYGGQRYGGHTRVDTVDDAQGGMTGPVVAVEPPKIEPDPCGAPPSRYGTIGHGSGTADPCGGGMRRRSGPTPQVTLGAATATGDLDLTIIRRYIKRNIQKVTYCYEKQLLVHAKLAGTVTVKFVISATGVVTSATAKGVHADVSSCIAEVVNQIEFPKPKDGGSVRVTYPIAFKPGA